jgi:branched-chain amino acid aminotransferase
MTADPILVHTGDAIVPAERAAVPILDHGFLFGDSVYEVVRTSNARPFLLREHLRRMRASASMIYFEMPWSDGEIERRLRETLERVGAGDCYFRIVATRGPGPLSLLPDGCDRPGLYVIGRRLQPYPEILYTRGCRLAVIRRLRNDQRALDPRAKTGNYLNNMLGLVESKRAGADDAIFLNQEDHLTESTTSNVWIVSGGRAFTPPVGEGLLAGITRDWIFETLPRNGIAVEERVLRREDCAAADEVFLSGTVKGIMPATEIDGAPVGRGVPGPVTRRAAELYDRALAEN